MSNRWVGIVAATVIGLLVVTVSLFVGGGWGLIVLEVAGAGLAIALFLRAQNDESDLEPDEHE